MIVAVQLYMMRTMLESLVSVRSSQVKQANKQLRAHLDSATIEAIEKFHKESLYYKQMLNFSR